MKLAESPSDELVGGKHARHVAGHRFKEGLARQSIPVHAVDHLDGRGPWAVAEEGNLAEPVTRAERRLAVPVMDDLHLAGGDAVEAIARSPWVMIRAPAGYVTGTRARATSSRAVRGSGVNIGIVRMTRSSRSGTIASVSARRTAR